MSNEHTPITSVKPVADQPSNPPRNSTIVRDKQAEASSPAPPAMLDELVATGPVSMIETRPPGEGSTILPTDTPYQLLRKIGSGAFGDVFEALAPGGVRVAVKRISRSVDHPSSKSERGALDSIKELSHPFLLKTNAYWVFDDRLVIVMELADGSLSDRIERHQSQGRLGVPPEELIPLFEQAGDALDYLHSQNVSHRDIKPENILILKGYAKVADFGLARIHEHTMTMVNNTVGTPAYMAPEMWKQKVSLQSDQYSLAATYVRARLGRQLFTTNVLVDLANFHIHETPNLDPLPPPEQKVLLKALSKDPDDRYRSCTEFAKALRAAVMPPPEPPKPEAKKDNARNVLFAMLGVAVVCAGVVGAVNYFTRKPDPQPVTTPENTEKEKPSSVGERKYAIYPDGWKPVDKDSPDSAVLLVDKYYHKKLTRKVGDRELTARLIYWNSAIRPEPFYMLEHKVTNKIFNDVWQRLPNDPKARTLLAKEAWMLGKWRKAESGRDLNLDGDDADLPVLGVTVPEAMLVADWLGGSLPTLRQWQKATGVLEDDATSGPAGPMPKPPAPLDKPISALTKEERVARAQWLSEHFKTQKLALGQPEPLPVTDAQASKDKSVWGIRQLVSNGLEWLCQNSADPPARITLDSSIEKEQQMRFVGHSVREVEIESVGGLLGYKGGEMQWLQVDGHYAGFRVVLEPR